MTMQRKFSRATWLTTSALALSLAVGVPAALAQGGAMDHSKMDHSKMDHGAHDAAPAQWVDPGKAQQGAVVDGKPVDNAGMDHAGHGAMGGGMMGHGGMGGGMGGGMAGMDHGKDQNGGQSAGHGGMMQKMICGFADKLDGRLAFLKAELKLTDAQATVWSTFETAWKAAAQAALAKCDAMNAHMDMDHGDMGVLGKLSMMETHMVDHLEVVRAQKAALEPLFKALTDDQKKTANEALSGVMKVGMSMGGGGMSGGMGGGGRHRH
jgi:hypothetical protein